MQYRADIFELVAVKTIEHWKYLDKKPNIAELVKRNLKSNTK